jgi:hypothetical protein
MNRHIMRLYGPSYLGLLLVALCLGVSPVSYAEVRRALLIGIEDYAPPSGAVRPTPGPAHDPDSRFAPGTTWESLHGPLNDVAGMQFLLTNRFGFHELRVLEQHAATREGILKALDQLIEDTRPGDFVVFYYAGHGSRRVDSLSSKNHFDETIVPIDAWQGVEDIRDKELAVRFNRIVYEKHAHLTAIFDSCDSGTMARGISESRIRALPYDDRDVAEEKRRDPRTVVESDLKQLPQHGDAIILAAAGPDEPAAEALYSDDLRWHGAFTRALVRVLSANAQSLSTSDLIADIAAVMHADPVPFQQPSAEGRIQQSLFGAPVSAHNLHVHVTQITAAGVFVDLGNAAGFDVGTQFTAIDPAHEATPTQLEIQRIDGPLRSLAKVVGGLQRVTVGQTFELTKITYPQMARLKIFAAPPESDAAAAAHKAFPALHWVADPTESPVDFLVFRKQQDWVAVNQRGVLLSPDHVSQGSAFLLLGVPDSVRTVIEHSVPFERKAFTFTSNIAEADYLLTLRQEARGSAVALFDPAIMTYRDPHQWVRSAGDDPEDAALNGGTAPEVVCRNDNSLPVRTAWLPSTNSNDHELALALLRRIMRLGKLRTWMQTPALAPGLDGWPYQLQISAPNTNVPLHGPLHPDEGYQVRLVTNAAARAAQTIIPRYVYLIGFDCGGNSYLFYPSRDLNGDAKIPQPGTNGVYPLSTTIGVEEAVGTPLGADTLFLLVSGEKLSDPGILVQDGVLEGGSRGVGNAFEALIADLNDAGTRGPQAIPRTWLVRQLVLASRP